MISLPKGVCVMIDFESVAKLRMNKEIINRFNRFYYELLSYVFNRDTV